jgi:Zn-dependent protease with chaperone function
LWLGVAVVAVGAVFALNRQAGNTQAGLIRGYRLGWAIGMAAALIQAFLLIPLLTYGLFEFTMLLTGKFWPQALFMIAVGGLIALGKTVRILLKKIPLEFNEAMAREVSEAEAPELWRAVRAAAARLRTEPPDRILTGYQFNFYVTELAVRHSGGRAEGRTLFLSLPAMKQLTEAEVLAIIGHELGHFIGADTRLSREFYPLRRKAQATMIAMARSGFAGWPSFQFLNFFSWCFGETERTVSRSRELLADQQAAALTSPPTAARALVRFQVAVEAFQRGLQEAGRNPLETPLTALVEEKLAGDAGFWTQLFEKKQPHPLDTHPPLQVRLAALGQALGPAEALAIARAEGVSAYQTWLGGHGALFAALDQQATEVLAKIQGRSALVTADYQTAAGRGLLDQHFPERRWGVRPGSYWTMIALLGLFTFISLMVMAVVRDPGARILFGLVSLALAWGMVSVYRRNRGGELVLTAEGLRATGWRRPLLFKDVRQITGQRGPSGIMLIFHWKTRQPPLPKLSLLSQPTARTGFSLATYQGKPAEMAEVIFKYFTRQAVK